MKFKTLLMLIAVVILLAGCATTQKYENNLSQWRGKHVDLLVSAWGPPHNTHKMADGKTIIEYVKNENVALGGVPQTTPQTAVPSQSPVYNVTMSCKTRFTLDKIGIIRDWSWEGDNCKSN